MEASRLLMAAADVFDLLRGCPAKDLSCPARMVWSHPPPGQESLREFSTWPGDVLGRCYGQLSKLQELDEGLASALQTEITRRRLRSAIPAPELPARRSPRL